MSPVGPSAVVDTEGTVWLFWQSSRRGSTDIWSMTLAPGAIAWSTPRPITTGHSNARSEGYNRLAKHVGRDAFGFRNPVNHRRRIRWSCTRQQRRLSARMTGLPG